MHPRTSDVVENHDILGPRQYIILQYVFYDEGIIYCIVGIVQSFVFNESLHFCQNFSDGECYNFLQMQTIVVTGVTVPSTARGRCHESCANMYL